MRLRFKILNFSVNLKLKLLIKNHHGYCKWRNQSEKL